jgi:hypothetical protein
MIWTTLQLRTSLSLARGSAAIVMLRETILLLTLEELGANTQKALGFCRTNPTVTAMQAVEQVTGAGH